MAQIILKDVRKVCEEKPPRMRLVTGMLEDIIVNTETISLVVAWEWAVPLRSKYAEQHEDGRFRERGVRFFVQDGSYVAPGRTIADFQGYCVGFQVEPAYVSSCTAPKEEGYYWVRYTKENEGFVTRVWSEGYHGPHALWFFEDPNEGVTPMGAAHSYAGPIKEPKP